MADVIQVKYEDLERLAARIHQRAEAAEAVHKRLRSQVEVLSTSWEGGGARAFQREMAEAVLPGLSALGPGLDLAADTMLKVSAHMRAAEEQTAEVLRTSSDGGGWMEWVHGTLDLAGLIPGFGEIADGVNGLIYLAEGRHLEAGLSAAAMIPIWGWAATGSKLAIRGGKEVLETAAERGAKEVAESATERSARESATRIPSKGQVRPPLPRGPNAPRAELNSFREPFRDPQMIRQQEEIMELAKTNPQAAGNAYEKLVARDFPGGPDVAEKFRRPGRVMDMGTEQEFTIAGREGTLGKEKLDQLWDDLADKGNVTLTVPRLSPTARDELARLLAQARDAYGDNRIIVVRETLP
jgi:WXG100 family type VII secretion target